MLFSNVLICISEISILITESNTHFAFSIHTQTQFYAILSELICVWASVCVCALLCEGEPLRRVEATDREKKANTISVVEQLKYANADVAFKFFELS